jgi:branched-chain amino acid aminotransferase
MNVYLNGNIIPSEQASVSIFDSGFLHGASTFTTMLAHNGMVFRLPRHLDRLLGTASLLGLRISATRAGLADAVDQVLKANNLKQARMRITLTSGDVHTAQPLTLVTAEALTDYPEWWYDKGITVVVSSFKALASDPTFGYKTGCYLPRLLARQEAAAKGAEEALWFNTDNLLSEACFNNVFLVLDGCVHTPPPDTPCLPGVARQAVLELCGQLNIPSDAQTPLTVKDMLRAQEIFLTGSTSLLRPVVHVERHSVGDAKPGAITRRLMEAYRQLLDKECPKA